jgi:hypothetical protein
MDKDTLVKRRNTNSYDTFRNIGPIIICITIFPLERHILLRYVLYIKNCRKLAGIYRYTSL